MDETVRVLHGLHEVITDTVFSGHFWRRIHELEQAREAGWFTFKLFEFRGKT